LPALDYQALKSPWKEVDEVHHWSYCIEWDIIQIGDNKRMQFKSQGWLYRVWS
jgi:hypothetical protein